MCARARERACAHVRMRAGARARGRAGAQARGRAGDRARERAGARAHWRAGVTSLVLVLGLGIVDSGATIRAGALARWRNVASPSPRARHPSPRASTSTSASTRASARIPIARSKLGMPGPTTRPTACARISTSGYPHRPGAVISNLHPSPTIHRRQQPSPCTHRQ